MKAVLRKIKYFLHRVTVITIGGVTVKFHTATPSDRDHIKAITGTVGYGEEIVLNAFISCLGEGYVVWDIGANIGPYTIPAAKKVGPSGNVVAFEPLGENVVKIQKNAKLNRLENVVVMEIALGDARDSKVLYYFLDPSGTIIDHTSSTLVKPTTQIKFFEMVIPVLRGDDLLDTYPIPEAVKIDVEGYESQVIEGMRKVLSSPSCKLLLCEVHVGLLPPNVAPDTFEQLFRSFGFKTIKKIPNKETFHLLCFKDGMSQMQGNLLK